jgi:tetratricopeptide (TPR) repeat protein
MATTASPPRVNVEPRPAPPPTWRDPWAWIGLAALVPLVVRSLGAPLCEPAAEDFDILRRMLLERSHSLFDGGGSTAFWRPVSFQIYFGLLGQLILGHPRWVAAVHVALLALATLLLFRLLRAHWGGWAAAAAASFPLLAESSRSLIAWPSQFSDLGVYLFSILALHEAARRRLWTASLALLVALLCKETAVVTAALLPFMPATPSAPRTGRARWLVASGVVLVAWAAVYQFVRGHAGLELPHGLESDARLLHTPLAVRLLWAWGNSLKSIFSLSVLPAAHDVVVGAIVGAIALAAIAAFARDATARERLRRSRAWVGWGLAWFALGAASLAPVFPLWSPVRSEFASAGLGVCAVGLTSAASPALTAALVATRLGAMWLAPPAPSRITPEPEDRATSVDFVRLARLQLLMKETRGALAARFPTLPHGARVGIHSVPLSTEYAYGGGHALQVWYRDTTLRWVTFGEFRADSAQPVAALIDYQPDHDPQVVLLDGAAVRFQLEAAALVRSNRWSEAVAALDRSDAAQGDTAAVVFLGDNAGRRAYCLAALGRFAEAEPYARRALRAAARDVGARFALATVLVVKGERATALAELDTLLAIQPDYEDAVALRRQLAASREVGRGAAAKP